MKVFGTNMRIYDPGHAISAAWSATSGPQAAKDYTAIYDLREGMVPGCADSVTPNQTYGGQACTYIHVNQGPFDSTWMKTTSSAPFNNDLKVRLYKLNGSSTDVKVLGTLEPVSGADRRTLVIQGGDHGDYDGPGQWFEIDGQRDKTCEASEPDRKHCFRS